MVSNMIKLSKKMVIISTPYRYHPLEFHTKIPFIHWLPKKIHRMILKKFNLVFYSKEENLNLLHLKTPSFWGNEFSGFIN